MPKQALWSSAGAPPGGAYSPGIRVGDYIFISSQSSRDAAGNTIGTTIEEQTAQVLKNIEAILSAAGASLDNVVKVGVFLSDLALFSRYNEVYASHFTDPKPARTTVGCQLPANTLIVIDAIAYVGDLA